MKFIIILSVAFAASPAFSQTKNGPEVLHLSNNIFTWEVENKISLLDNLFSNKFKVVTSRGEVQTKEQYLKTLGSGNITHDSISVEQNTVTIAKKTAIVTGKGWFHMTVSGNKIHRHLSYMEVFVKQNKAWKLMALYASALPD